MKVYFQPETGPVRELLLPDRPGVSLHALLIEAGLEVPPYYAVLVNGSLRSVQAVVDPDATVEIFPPLSGG
ncbi:hypothetical protein MGLY_07110 [Neomoorella glycerini]|uniref:MoaD/ThiS family protein n=1 Tax=Neomoorella glycerini TaxID=55779 RepID=A0A6I5ZP95_9FIRM|nr:MoaD/ThiS family protein [Moorella glycerini]QGP91379.1 hypothetical protein MGLY_07110 [Moorella glycerini]